MQRLWRLHRKVDGFGAVENAIPIPWGHSDRIGAAGLGSPETASLGSPETAFLGSLETASADASLPEPPAAAATAAGSVT